MKLCGRKSVDDCLTMETLELKVLRGAELPAA